MINKIILIIDADTPKDAITAINFGATGIGLCRTEHMFFKKDRISTMRKMILSQTTEEQKNWLSQLEAY